MAKKCPACGKTMLKEWNRTSSHGPELWGWSCKNCNTFVNKSTGQIDWKLRF